MSNKTPSRLSITATNSPLKNITQIHTEGDTLIFQLGPSEKPLNISSSQREKILISYSTWIKEKYSRLPTAGMPLPQLGIQQNLVNIELDEIFIRLRAVRPRPETEIALSNKAESYSRSINGTEILRTIIQSLKNTTNERGKPTKEKQETEFPQDNLIDSDNRVIDPEAAINDYRFLVLIGGPGSGKSTLLRHIAWRGSHQNIEFLNLLIHLGRLDVRMSESGLSFIESALELLTDHLTGVAKLKLRAVLLWLISEKKVRFLLDGLDEVHSHLQDIRDAIESLRAEGHRLLVTSRPTGYTHLGGFNLFEVLPLVPSDAQAFTYKWFKALAVAKKIVGKKSDEWVSNRANWLETQLVQRPALQELAQVPLFLTFLVILAGDDPQMELPRKRADLFKVYIERLITGWEVNHRGRKKLTFGEFSGDEANNFAQWGLFNLALCLHQAFYGNVVYEIPTKSELTQKLGSDINITWKIPKESSDQVANQLIQFWQDAGILELYHIGDEEWLSFRHLTFQEYGAARMLSINFHDAAEKLWWQHLRYYVQDSQWAEVIPLTLAHLPEKSCDYIFRQLLFWEISKPASLREEYLDPFLFRGYEFENRTSPLLIAAKALADGSKSSRELQYLIVLKLLAVIERDNYGRSQLGMVQGNLPSLSLISDTFSRFEPGSNGLFELIKISKNVNLPLSTKKEIGKILSHIGEKQIAKDILIGVVNDVSASAREKLESVELLYELGLSTQSLDFLREITRDTNTDIEDRLGAAEALIRYGNRENGVNILLELSKNVTIDEKYKLEVARNLIKYVDENKGHQLVLDVAKKRIAEAKTRIKATELLWKIGDKNQALDVLEYLAADQTISTDDRWNAIETLARLFSGERIINILIDTAKDNSMSIPYRCKAIDTLASIGQVDLSINLLSDLDNIQIKGQELLIIAELFCRLGVEEKGTLIAQKVLKTINTDFNVRLKAIEILGKTNARSDAILWLLEQMKNSATSINQRWAIVRIIVDLGWQNLVSDTLKELSVDRQSIVSTEFTNLLKMAKDEDLFSLLKKDVSNYGLQLEIVYILIRRGKITEVFEFLQSFIQNERILAVSRLDAASVFIATYNDAAITDVAQRIFSDETSPVEAKRRALWMLFETNKKENLLVQHYRLLDDPNLHTSTKLDIFEDLFLLDEKDKPLKVLIKFSKANLDENTLWFCIEKIRLYGHHDDLVTYLDETIEIILDHNSTDREEKLNLYWEIMGVYSSVVDKPLVLKRIGEHLNIASELSLSTRLPTLLFRLGFPKEAGTAYQAIANNPSIQSRTRGDAIRALIKLGFAEEAKTVLIQLSESNDTESGSSIQTASMLALLGDETRASQIFNIVVSASTNKKDQTRAIAALSRLGRVNELKKICYDTSMDATLRLQSAQALSDIGEIELAEEVFSEIAQAENLTPEIRYQATRNLVLLDKVNTATTWLIGIIKTSKKEVRVIANCLNTLKQLGGKEYIRSIALDTILAPEIRMEALKVLSTYHESKEIISILDSIVSENYDKPSIVISAADIASSVECLVDAENYLKKSINEANISGSKKELVQKLQKLDRGNALADIILDEHVSQDLKEIAFESIKNLKSVTAFNKLINSENIKFEWRIQIAEILGSLGDQEVVFSFLTPILDTVLHSRALRLQAAIVLIKFRETDSVKSLLQELVGDTTIDPVIRKSALQKLQNYGMAKLIGPVAFRLAQNLSDQESLREYAVDLMHTNSPEKLQILVGDESVSTNIRLKSAYYIAKDSVESNGISGEIRDVLIEDGIKEDTKISLSLDVADLLKNAEFKDAASNICFVVLQREISDKERQRAINLLSKLNQVNLLKELAGKVDAISTRFEVASALSNLGDQDSASLILTDILRGVGSKTQRLNNRLPQSGENQISEKSFDILVKDHRDNELKKLAYSAWLNPKIRLRSAQAMVNLGNYLDAIDVLKYIARDLTVDLSLRVEAALGLGELNITDIAVDAAKQLFRDPKISDDVSRKAAICLLKYSPPNSISTILQSKYLSSNNRLAIAKALIELGQSDYGISICREIVLSESEDLEAGKKSITLLKEIKAQNVIDEILSSHNIRGSIKYFALVPIEDTQKDKLSEFILDIGIDETATTIERFALGKYLLEHEMHEGAYDILKRLAKSSRAPTSGLLGKINVQPERQSIDLIASSNQIDALKEIWIDSNVNVDMRFYAGQKLIELLDTEIINNLIALLGDTEKDTAVRRKSAMLLSTAVIPDDTELKKICLSILIDRELKQELQDACVDLFGKYSLDTEAINFVADKSASVENRLKLSRCLTIKTDNPQWLVEIVKEILHQDNSQEGNRNKKIKNLAIDYLEELKLFSFLAEISLDRSIDLDIRSYALIKAINLIASKDQVQLLLPLLEDNGLTPQNRLTLLLSLQKVGYDEDVPKKIYEFTLLVTFDDEEDFDRVPNSNNSSKQPTYIVPAVNQFPSYIESAINALGKTGQTELLNSIVVNKMLALRTRYLAINQLIEAGAKPDAPLEFWIELAKKEKPFYVIEKRTTKDIRMAAVKNIVNYDRATLYNIAATSSFDVSYRISIIKELVDSSSPSDLLKIIDGMSSEKTPDRLEIAYLYTLLGDSQKAKEHYLYIVLNPVKQAGLQLSSLVRGSGQPAAQPHMTSVDEIMRLGNENILLETAKNSIVDGNVREYIIDKLGSTKNKNFIDLLVSIARRTDFDSAARKNAMIRLVQNGFASDVITIGSEIIRRNQGDQSLQQNVVDIMVELHEIDTLKKALLNRDVYHEIKIYVIKRLLSTSDAEEYTELLLQYANDTSLSAYNRLQAVIVLLNIKDFDDPVEIIFSSVGDANPNLAEFKELSTIFFELLTNYKVNWYDLIFDGQKNLHLRKLMIDRVKDKSLLRSLAVDQSLNKVIRLLAAARCRNGESGDIEIDSIIKQFISDHEVDANTRLSIANNLLVQKNPDLAREGFKSVASESHADEKIRAKAATETAKINYTLKEYENAEQFCLLAIKLGEKSADNYLNLGNAYLQQKKYKYAIASYMQALELNPAWKDILRVVGDSYFHIEEYEDAVRFYKQYINEYKKDTIYVWNNMALSDMALGNYDDATTAYLMMIELSPEGVDNLEKVVQGFMGLGKYQEAENFLEKALKINSNFQHKYFEYLGKLRFWQQDIDNSIKYLQLAIESDPSCPSAPLMLAQMLFLSGKEKDAWDVLQKITITPTNLAMIQWQVGSFYFNQGRFEVAKKHIEEALRIDSQYPDQILSGIRFGYPGNKALFEKAYSVKINNSATIESYICLSFGAIFGMTGQSDLAIKYLKKALKLNSRNLEAKSMLNEIFSRKPGIRKILRKIREILAFDILGRLSKDKAEQSLLNLYDYYFQIKDFEYALYYINWAIKLSPINSRYYSIKGMTLRRLERYLDAMKAFDSARKLEPSNVNYYLSWISIARINGLYPDALQGLLEILKDGKHLDQESLLMVHMGLASVYDHLNSKEDFILHVSKAKKLTKSASEYDLACLESIQHNIDESILAISKAAQANDFNFEWCFIDPDLENVRQDARFGPTVSKQLNNLF